MNQQFPCKEQLGTLNPLLLHFILMSHQLAINDTQSTIFDPWKSSPLASAGQRTMSIQLAAYSKP